jgi:phosphohistidine phosphatase
MKTSMKKDPDSGAYQIYIMRHGIAQERGGQDASDDAQRKLTPEGREKTREIAKGLKRVGFAVDWIVTSPLVRALETAEIVRDTLKLDAPFEHCDALRPGLNAAELMKFLSKRPERKRVLLVGHEPDLGFLAASLLGAGDETNLAFKKGGCCLIAVEQLPPRSPGELVWWLAPRVLRALA